MSIFRDYINYRLANVIKKLAPTFYERQFEAAQANRLTADWNSFTQSINSDLKIGLQKLRERSRDLVQNDPYAKKFFKMLGKNAVGPEGFILRNKAWKEEIINGVKTFPYDKETNLLIQEVYKEFCNKKYCTVTRDLSQREATKLMIQSIARDGEIFVVKIKGNNVNKFGYTQQFITAEYVDETYNSRSPEGRTIAMGIEYDEYRRPVNYYFKKNTIEDELLGYLANRDYIKVPANRVNHLFVKESFNQLRGIPWLAPTIIRLKMLKGFEDASLVNARASAMTTNIIEPIESKSVPLSTANVAGSNQNANGDLVQNLQPGQTHVIPKGFRHVTHNPNFPHQQHKDFRNTILMGAASGLDVSFIRLANDYSEVNYTSSRTSLLDEWDTWRDLHSWIRENYLEDNFETFLTMAITTGALQLPMAEFERFNVPHFQGRSWPWVNPKDEVAANVSAYKNRLKPLSKILAEQGMDFEETIDQFAYEDEYMKNKGVAIIENNAPTPQNESDNIKDNVDDDVDENSNGKAKKNMLKKIFNKN